MRDPYKDPQGPSRAKYSLGCKTCDGIRKEGGFGPPHEASPRCESGKRNHCSCDTCF